MTLFLQDARYALRGFRKSPVFTAVAALSLALGIGANTAIFTLVDQLILRMLPIREPARLVLLRGRGNHYGGNNGINALSYPMYQDFRARNAVFDGMMCRYRYSATIGAAGQTEVIMTELVSGNYFPLLGVGASAGRVFTAQDDLYAGRHPYAVISYAYWQTRFGGDPHIIGEVVRVNNYPITIVGVSKPGFDGMEPGLPAQIFIPMAMAESVRPGFNSMWNRRQRWVNVYGRLKHGESIPAAQAGLQPLFHQIISDEVLQPPFRHASDYDRQQFLRMWIDVMPGSQGNTSLRRKYETPLLVLMGVVGLVLLIACANLASLLTARAHARQREMAIRLAMGSSRARIVRQLLTESVLLSAAGGVAGTLLAVGMVRGLVAFLPSRVAGYAISTSPDARMLAFTFLLALVTGVGFGLVPAWQSTSPAIAPTLKAQAGNVMGGHAQVAFRKLLVSAQVGLSLLLLIGAGIFTRSLGNLKSLNPGFETGHLLQFSTAPYSVGYDPVRGGVFYRDLETRLRHLPGVESAGMGSIAVLGGNEWDNSVAIDTYRPKTGENIEPHFDAVTAGYFDALHMRLLAGRVFDARDREGAPKVAVVNATFARRYFGNGVAVGHRIGLGSDPGTRTDIEIAGVVNDTRYESLRDEIPQQVYLCAAQQDGNWSLVTYVRTAREPAAAFRSIRSLVREMDANLPVTGMKTLDTQLDESLVTERMIATLSSVFGALATVLSIIGLYGVMAFMVERRSREIGIRMALGAQAGNVLWMVMREVLVLVSIGIVAGLPAAYALTQLVRTQLYGVEPTDPVSIALSTLVLALVALAAGYVPALRAARYDPVRVLRYE